MRPAHPDIDKRLNDGQSETGDEDGTEDQDASPHPGRMTVDPIYDHRRISHGCGPKLCAAYMVRDPSVTRQSLLSTRVDW